MSMDSVTVTRNETVNEVDLLKQENERLKMRLDQAVLFEEDQQFQGYIDGPPVPTLDHLWSQACSGDIVTVSTWLKQWIDQMRENSQKFNFNENSCAQLLGANAYKPCIIAGSGPSLKKNAHLLRDRKGICLVSCLHNFGYLADMGIFADYYINLDAGVVTETEMHEGGKEKPEYYWELTKNHKLVSAITGWVPLHEKWRGEKYFYAVTAPESLFVEEMRKITDLNVFFSVGGNTLGAAYYFARAVLGSNPCVFVGADFSFSPQRKFYPFNYNEGVLQCTGVVPVVNIYGNRTWTWQSYFNFKSWLEFMSCGGKGHNPAFTINCTEGGILGAYPQGNIRQILQLRLDEFLRCYNLHTIYPEKLKDKNAMWYLF